MSSRFYPVVVALWVIAAILAMAYTFAGRISEPAGEDLESRVRQRLGDG